MVSFTAAILATVTLLVTVVNAQPVVTLSHGGKLQGRSETFRDKPVDVFLGVRYAKPPVGDLRFKKPEAQPAWEGVVEATTVGYACPQPKMSLDSPSMEYVGQEDCLFLDITVPGGVQSTGAKKPVMVWIHGGGFTMGTGLAYIGAGIANVGDVIVVSINYRLGVLGFLSAGKGTGNFGLWDQRAALVWVKENIEQFGGDPELVTIFGESAGSISVSAHMIGQHNEGLFKRGIMQSGAAFALFGTSENKQNQVAEAIRQHTGCADDVSVYDCMRDMTAEDIVTKLQLPVFIIPTADSDFFSDETVSTLSYDLSRRFDLMAGVNGQEGGLFYALEVVRMAAQMNESAEHGVSMELAKAVLNFRCQTMLTPLSPNMCVYYIIKEYKLDEVEDDVERAKRLTDYLGETFFDMDTAKQLEEHSTCDQSTYAYYFTELYKTQTKKPLWTIPDWLKARADHGDEVVYMFGAFEFNEEIEKNSLWQEMLDTDETLAGYFKESIPTPQPQLSVDMMKMWTNFARTGNPNKPAALSSDIPTWPEFTPESNQWMELNSKKSQLIPTPNKERLDSVRENLDQAKWLQLKADIVRPKSVDQSKDREQPEQQETHDEL